VSFQADRDLNPWPPDSIRYAVRQQTLLLAEGMALQYGYGLSEAKAFARRHVQPLLEHDRALLARET
jgi:hypothetical protein